LVDPTLVGAPPCYPTLPFEWWLAGRYRPGPWTNFLNHEASAG